MINTLLYTMPSFKMTQRWFFWKWRQLGIMRSFKNLLNLLLSSKVPSNGKSNTLCIHSHPILGSGNRWGTICHWHWSPHTQLMLGETSVEILMYEQDVPHACSSSSFPQVHDFTVWKSGWGFGLFFSPSIDKLMEEVWGTEGSFYRCGSSVNKAF